MPRYKLICFDVDGTLIDNLEFSWQIFHDYFKSDVKKRESAKADFYSGKISYLEWARHDINLWIEGNATRDEFYNAIDLAGLKIMNGAENLLNILKQSGFKLAIISGTLNIILDRVFPEYENIFDYIFLSRLYFDAEGRLTRAVPTSFDMDKKADALIRIANAENITLKECVFIGDHHNDVKISKIAGLGIAFNCKSKELMHSSDVIIDKKDLMEVMKYLH